MRKNIGEQLERNLRSKITFEPNTGCWLWLGMLDAEGYGYIKIEGRRKRVHRVVYELNEGAIPAGLVPDHLCRVRCCCNPKHLEPVTVAVNHARGDQRKVAGKYLRERTHCKNGHEFNADNTRYRGNARVCRACSGWGGYV